MNTHFVRIFRKCIWSFIFMTPLFSGAQIVDTNYKKINVSLGYGLASYFYSPNQEVTKYYLTDTLNSIYSSQTKIVVTDVKIKPLYLRFDYKWDPKNSIGLMTTFNGYIASGERTDSIWNESVSNYSISKSDLFYSMYRLRIQMVYTRHFFVDRPRVNTYFYTALGANLIFSKSKEATSSGLPSDSGLNVSRGFPIAGRICYGLRYKFSENMCLHTEVGLGGPLLSLGLTAMF
jgi:hypothetical protein